MRTQARLCVLCAMALACACARTPANIEWQAPTMGTTYTVKAVSVPSGITKTTLQAEVEDILRQVDRIFSTYRADSEISRFNRANTRDWLPVSDAMITLVDVAQSLSLQTGGAFDITLGPLADLWGFGPSLHEMPQVPSKAEIAKARGRVGYQKLRHRQKPAALRKTIGDLQIDLNALAAGYAADQVAARFNQLGLKNYLVDMGGEYRLRGNNSRGRVWSIAVERPQPGTGITERVLALTDCAIATSGDYRNYFEADKQHYTHILDGRSGLPVRHDLASVTVLAQTALQADAFATALLILGEQQGYALAEQRQIAALFISRKNDGFVVQESPAFAAYLQ